MNNLQSRIKTKVLFRLQKELGIKNPLAIPQLSKIVVNIGVKDALSSEKKLESAALILSQITGQKPKRTKARKSISSFKLREGDEIGLMVTLRGRRMYDFFEKLITIILPRLRDFHGVQKTSFDGQGNHTLGFSEYTVFPEVDPGKVDQTLAGQGLEVTIVSTAKDDKEGLALLTALGMPFRKV